MKPTIYIETTIVSYLTSRPSRDLVAAAYQQITQDWWYTRSSSFDLFISQYEPPVLCTPQELLEE